MPVRVYRSTDQGAPVVNGTPGTLIALLRACLVDGYGSQQPAGWSMPFANAGYTKAVFKQGAFSGPPNRPQYHLRVVDDGTLAAGGREATWQGYESMSDIDTGTNQFPISPSSLCVRKSNTADATARPWVLVADHRTFILFIQSTAFVWPPNPAWFMYSFGDYVPIDPNNPYPCMIMAKTVFNTTHNNPGGVLMWRSDIVPETSTVFLARNYSGAVSSKEARKAASVMANRLFDDAATGAGVNSWFGVQVSNPVDGRVWVSRLLLVETPIPGGAVSGFMRGLWAPTHEYNALVDGAQVQGAGEASGRILEFRQPVRTRDDTTNQAQTSGGYYVEISDTWDV